MAMSFFKAGGVCPVQLVENSIVTLLTNKTLCRFSRNMCQLFFVQSTSNDIVSRMGIGLISQHSGRGNKWGGGQSHKEM